MEFFTPCWMALSLMFGNNNPSKSYLDAHIHDVPKRLQICNQVAQAAAKRNFDPILAIAISFNETKFTNTVSEKGARGPMGVIPKYHCPKKGKCDYIEAGLNAFEKAEALGEDDLCQTLAIYNRGPEKGKCVEGRSEYAYAQYVLKIYDMICAATDFCQTC